MKKLVLSHVAFELGNQICKDGMILIEGGRIQRISSVWDAELLDGAVVRDMNGLWVYPAWIDSHLHIPGALLFQLYGIDFRGCETVDQYVEKLQQCKVRLDASRDLSSGNWIRGFGWNAIVMARGGYQKIASALKEIFPNREVLLFSDDYHSCICSEQAIEKIQANGISVQPDEWGVVYEKNIFQLTEQLPQMTFSEEEMARAILIYQEKLLRLGITAVQTLMFLGGNGEQEWKVLKALDQRGKLKIKVNLSLTVQPYEDLEGVEGRYQRLKKYESEHIRLHTIKIYMDGVVENRTAYLLEPYEGTKDRGTCFWNLKILKDFCTHMDLEGRQIHIHAIGDGAVRTAVHALTAAMDRNRSAGKHRHVITHLQLAEDSDIQKMADYGIIAAIQPYWFPGNETYYGLEAEYLGERAKKEYKAGTMEKAGVLLTGSSDSPVTECPDPLTGIRMASQRFSEKERVSVRSMEWSFTKNGAYQLFREKELGELKEGFRADLIGVTAPIAEDSIQETRLSFVMADGEEVWSEACQEAVENSD